MNNNFIIWRREASQVHGQGPLQEKIREAKTIMEEEDHDEVLIVEVKHVVKRRPMPIIVEKFK